MKDWIKKYKRSIIIFCGFEIPLIYIAVMDQTVKMDSVIAGTIIYLFIAILPELINYVRQKYIDFINLS